MSDDERSTRTPSQAHAGGPPATAGLRALDRLIAAYGAPELLSGAPTPGAADGMAAVVGLLCAEAHRTNPGHAERMVIALHAAWPTLPAVQHLPPGDGTNRLLARVVALTIAGFYRSVPGAEQMPARDGAP